MNNKIIKIGVMSAILIATTEIDAKTISVEVNALQIKQKMKQILYLAAPAIIMNGICPGLTTDIVKKIVGDPDYQKRCLVSDENFKRITIIVSALFYSSLASYFWPKALNTNDNVYKH